MIVECVCVCTLLLAMVFTELLISDRFVIQVVDLKAWNRDRTQNVNRLFGCLCYIFFPLFKLNTHTQYFKAKFYAFNSLLSQFSTESSSAKLSILELLQINC